MHGMDEFDIGALREQFSRDGNRRLGVNMSRLRSDRLAWHDSCNDLFLKLSNSVIANIDSTYINAILFFMRACSSLKADCIISSSLERKLWVYVFVLHSSGDRKKGGIGKWKKRQIIV